MDLSPDAATEPTSSKFVPRKPADLPGPRGLPFVGVANKIDHKALHADLERWYAKYKGPYRFKLGPRQFVVFADPEPVRQLLQNRPTQFRRSRQLAGLMDELGVNGVFSSEGAAWRKQRRLLTQGFSREQLRRFFPQLRMVTDKLRRRWLDGSKSASTRDLKRDFECFTIDVTTLLAFGRDVDMLGKANDPLQRNMEVMFPALGRRLASPFPYWRWVRLPQDRAVDRAMENVRETIGALIAEAQARLANDVARRDAPETLLEAMIAAEYADNEAERFTADEIYSNVITLLFAGEDTTAHTLAWLIFLLGENPDCYRRLQVEVDRVLGDDTMVPDLDTMKLLPYLDALINETHRLKSVAPLLFLQPLEPTIVAGIELLPSDIAAVITREAALRDSSFTDPQEFRPERWLRDDPAMVERYPQHEPKAVLAFGGGPRICPGRSLSYVEVHAVMSMLARTFDLEVDRRVPTRELFEFTMVPDHVEARLRRRGSARASNNGAC